MLHPETVCRQPEYRWNEWDLRREALQLANMSNKSHLASQTVWSESHREAGVQVDDETAANGPSTETCTQTPVWEAATSTSSYVSGLRGYSPFPVQHVRVADALFGSN